MSRKKIIFIFLKNKIISLDSIIPFAMEVHNKCNIDFIFVAFEKGTYDAIRNDNVVLNDAIESIGSLIYIYRAEFKNTFVKKIALLLNILLISIQIRIKDGYVLHFGGLNEKPIVLLRWLFPLSRIILSESCSAGRIAPVDRIKEDREFSSNIINYQCRADNIPNFGDKSKHAPMNASILLGFHKTWNYFKHRDATKVKKIIFTNSRVAPEWHKFIFNNADNYINSELEVFKHLSPPPEKIITFIIGRLKYDTEITRIHREAFKEALLSLAKYSEHFPIFIKPKIYDDMNIVQNLVNEVNEVIPINYVFTKLHPIVLAKRSITSVFVDRSTVINDFYIYRVPIVQNLKGFDDNNFHKLASPLSSYIVSNSSGDLNQVFKKILTGEKVDMPYVKEKKSMIDCSIF
jgi:hypothetical protein